MPLQSRSSSSDRGCLLEILIRALVDKTLYAGTPSEAATSRRHLASAANSCGCSTSSLAEGSLIALVLVFTDLREPSFLDYEREGCSMRAIAQALALR